MNLSALAGNQRIKDQLSQQERERGLSHAYILSGPAGSGRHVLARQLAAAMLCTGTGERPCGRCVPCQKAAKGIHPDLSVIAGPEEGKPITVDQVRALRADAYIRPNEGERKVYLLEHADRMNPSAQNAMLKLLEEGPAYAAFLLLAENGTVTVCHSKTKNLKEVTSRADIVVAAVGKPKFITADYIKEGAVVIDVGIHRNAEGKLCGDVDFASVAPKAYAVTPVPGGVGPMTIAMLMANCVNGIEE